MKPFIRKVIWTSVLVTALVAATGGGYLRSRPVGLFQAKPIVGYHDARDVLRFSGGLVTLETCCGDSPLGAYHQTNGSWVWDYGAARYTVSPGVTCLTCRDIADSNSVFTLDRRFSAPPEDGHGLD